jgi:hypothetical protein
MMQREETHISFVRLPRKLTLVRKASERHGKNVNENQDTGDVQLSKHIPRIAWKRPPSCSNGHADRVRVLLLGTIKGHNQNESVGSQRKRTETLEPSKPIGSKHIFGLHTIQCHVICAPNKTHALLSAQMRQGEVDKFAVTRVATVARHSESKSKFPGVSSVSWRTRYKLPVGGLRKTPTEHARSSQPCRPLRRGAFPSTCLA